MKLAEKYAKNMTTVEFVNQFMRLYKIADVPEEDIDQYYLTDLDEEIDLINLDEIKGNKKENDV
eukprot:1960539-Ditylum_brightwellii.AAC.1